MCLAVIVTLTVKIAGAFVVLGAAAADPPAASATAQADAVSTARLIALELYQRFAHL
jgi:hypothetical protein